jgi:hypothetical protein
LPKCVFLKKIPLQTQEEKNVKNKWFLGVFSSIARLPPREGAINCQISVYSVPTSSQNIIRRVLNFIYLFIYNKYFISPF